VVAYICSDLLSILSLSLLTNSVWLTGTSRIRHLYYGCTLDHRVQHFDLFSLFFTFTYLDGTAKQLLTCCWVMVHITLLVLVFFILHIPEFSSFLLGRNDKIFFEILWIPNSRNSIQRNVVHKGGIYSIILKCILSIIHHNYLWHCAW
jgi:hypothetical protein